MLLDCCHSNGFAMVSDIFEFVFLRLQLRLVVLSCVYWSLRFALLCIAYSYPLPIFLFCLFPIDVRCSLFWIPILWHYVDCNCLLLLHSLYFHFVICRTKVCLSTDLTVFMVCAFCVLKSPSHYHKDIHPSFLQNMLVLFFTFRSLNHWEYTFVYSIR